MTGDPVRCCIRWQPNRGGQQETGTCRLVIPVPGTMSPTMRNVAVVAAMVALACCKNLVEAAQAPGPDAFGYTVQLTTQFTFLQITNTGATRVLWFDDDTPYTANIGFVFNFYGSNYSTVSFNPNGLMTFGGASSDYANVDLSMAAPSNNLP